MDGNIVCRIVLYTHVKRMLALWEIKWFRVSVLFIGWVFTTGAAALYSKSFLKLTPMPLYLTFCQAFVGLVFSACYLRTKGPIQPLSGNFSDIFVVIACHFLGTSMTNIATGQAAASFVNTLKAADPLFGVWGAKYILNQEFTWLTYLSLITIVVGIVLACTTEFDFQLGAFLNAMISTGFFVARAIFTKKMLKNSKLNGQTIFWYISVFTCFFSFFPTLYEIRVNGSDKFFNSLDFNSESSIALWKAVLSHYGYNFLSFFLVAEVDALTYSVGNAVKRLVTIYSAILYFRNPVTTLNMAASFVAVLGVFLYGYDRDQYNKRATSKKGDVESGGK